MFVRETRRRNADGSVVAYLQLASSFRDRLGRPRTRVLLSLGRADRVDRNALASVVASLGGRSDPARAVLKGRASVLRSREAGGVWLLDELWRTSGLRTALLSAARARPRMAEKLERTALSLVAHHALRAGSKRSVARWVTEDVAVLGCDRMSRSVMYDALDLLLTTRTDTINTIAAFATTLAARDAQIHNPQELDVVLLDVAAEQSPAGKDPGEAGDTILPRTLAVIAVNSCGLPIYSRLHDDNVSVGTVVDEIRRFFAHWPIRRLIRFDYDGTELRCRWANGIVDSGANGSLGQCRDTRVKELRPELMRESLRLESTSAVDRSSRRPRNGEDGTVWRFLDLEGIDLGKALPDGRPATRSQRVVTYLVQAPADLEAFEVAMRCSTLLRRVRGWQRVMAGVQLGPVWHYRQDRVDAHAHLVLLATFLLCAAEEMTGDYWTRILATLNGLRVATMSTPAGEVDLRTAVTPDQETMFRALNLSLPPEIYGLRLGTTE